jgi:paraquat-inducible protein B
MTAGKQTALGAFVLFGMGLAIGAVVFFGNFNFGAQTDHAAIIFQGSISGLSVGAPVTFHGVPVGSVQSISIAYDEATHTAFIPVVIALDKDNVRIKKNESVHPPLSQMIQNGLRAEVNTVSFVTGQAEIALEIDPSSPATLHPGISPLPEIPTKVSPIGRIEQQLSTIPFRELVDNGNATLHSLRALSDKLDVDLPPLLVSLKTTVDHTGQTADAGTQAIADVQQRLDATLTSIDRLVRSGDQQVVDRGDDLHIVLSDLQKTILHARSMINNVCDMTNEHAGDRINAEQAIRDLAAATDSLRGFASDVEHNPQLLLTGRRP